jgi:heptosyltransferase-2
VVSLERGPVIEPEKILIRATNWVGDAVMSLPAIRAVQSRFPKAEVTVLARPWVAELYLGESSIARVIPYAVNPGPRDWRAKWRLASRIRAERFDWAILLQNAFEAAAFVYAAGIPRRIGYARDGRGWMLTDAIPVPGPGDTPLHQRFYYLELLRRAEIVDRLPPCPEIRLERRHLARQNGQVLFGQKGIHGPVIGVSPGAAYGNAKRWVPEHFASAATRLAGLRNGTVALFGSSSERPLCEQVAGMIQAPVCNFAGQTSLAGFIDMAAACEVFLTNDSGAMHIASALGVPTVTVFGATDHIATGPTGDLAQIIREPVDCSPCLKRECPIDHRCMTRVQPERVVEAALDLLK